MSTSSILVITMHFHPRAVVSHRFGIVLIGLLTLSGCSKAQQPQPAPKKLAALDQAQIAQRIEALKAKTRKDLVFVKDGSFQMGDFGPIHNKEELPYSPERDDDVLHKVTLDSYSIGAYKVVFADFDVYTDAIGKPRIAMGKADDYRRPDSPAGVSWPEARGYCQWIGQQLGVPMDLPTEAQWEYAARSLGQMHVYPTDNGKVDTGRNVPSFEQLEAYAEENNIRSIYKPRPAGDYPPNPLGLFDLIANGREWVLDWYSPSYDKASPERNPPGPNSGTKKVLRGYDGGSGDNLRFVSMTFTRQKSDPSLPPSAYKGILTGSNQHSNDVLRCVANHPEPIKP